MKSRALFLLLACLGVSPVVRAHADGECGLVLSADEENLQLRLTVPLASAAALLDARTNPPLSAENFDLHRPDLLAAMAGACQLLDADRATLAPDRILVTLRNGHEVRFDFLFPVSSRPALLRLPFLSAIQAGASCEVSDLLQKIPARAVLSPKSPEFSLAPSR